MILTASVVTYAVVCLLERFSSPRCLVDVLVVLVYIFYVCIRFTMCVPGMSEQKLIGPWRRGNIVNRLCFSFDR